MTALKFLVFYATFMLFVVFIGTLAGISIFEGAEGIETIIPTSAYDLINPLWFINAVWVLFSISSEFALLYTIVIAPFFVGVVYIVAALVRGVSP